MNIFQPFLKKFQAFISQDPQNWDYSKTSDPSTGILKKPKFKMHEDWSIINNFQLHKFLTIITLWDLLEEQLQKQNKP